MTLPPYCPPNPIGPPKPSIRCASPFICFVSGTDDDVAEEIGEVGQSNGVRRGLNMARNLPSRRSAGKNGHRDSTKLSTFGPVAHYPELLAPTVEEMR